MGILQYNSFGSGSLFKGLLHPDSYSEYESRYLDFQHKKIHLSIGRYIVKMSPHVNKQGTSTVLSNPPVIFNN